MRQAGWVWLRVCGTVPGMERVLNNLSMCKMAALLQVQRVKGRGWQSRVDMSMDAGAMLHSVNMK